MVIQFPPISRQADKFRDVAESNYDDTIAKM